MNWQAVRHVSCWVITVPFSLTSRRICSAARRSMLGPRSTQPPWVGAMSTSQRAVMLCGWGIKAGMVREWVAGKAVWSRCSDIWPSLAISSSHNKALYTSVRLLLLLLFCNHTSLFTFYVREMATPRIFILERALHPSGGATAVIEFGAF